MPCYTPLNAFRTKTDSQNYGITFNENSPDIIYPIKLPCGQCIGCRLEHARQWAVRCVHESQLHQKNCFITLTINDENLDKNLSLDKTDFQLFMKRLRKKYPKKSYGHIGYYMCGEYGDNFGRPHYHACLFNFDFPDKEIWKKTPDGQILYTSKILQSLWQDQGYCIIGDVTFESAAYVARYVTKKIKGKKAASYYGDRVPEYTGCSKKPAIGLNWIKQYHEDVYNFDELIMRGKKMRPSRYYDKFYEKNFPSEYTDLKINREFSTHLQSLSSENDLSRVNVKHEIQLLKQKEISRSYEIDLDPTKARTLDDAQQQYDQRCVDYNKQILKEGLCK